MEKSNGRIPRHIEPARYCISVKGGLRGTQKKMKFKMARYVNYLTTRYAYAIFAKIVKIAKIATRLGDLSSQGFRCSAIFAIFR